MRLLWKRNPKYETPRNRNNKRRKIRRPPSTGWPLHLPSTTLSDTPCPIPLLVRRNKLPFLCSPLFHHWNLTAYYEVCFEFMGPQGRQKLARWGCERAKYKGDRKWGWGDGWGGAPPSTVRRKVGKNRTARYFCCTVKTWKRVGGC